MVHSHSIGSFAGKRDVPDELEVLGVDNVNEVSLPTGFVATALDVKILVDGIKHCLVHSIRKFYLVNDLIILCAHQFDPAEIISSIGHDKLVGVRQINNVVRFPEACDGVNPFACAEIKNLHRFTVPSANTTNSVKNNAIDFFTFFLLTQNCPPIISPSISHYPEFPF